MILNRYSDVLKPFIIKIIIKIISKGGRFMLLIQEKSLNL